MATQKTIQEELKKLLVCYPYPDRSGEEIKTLLEVWSADFALIDDDLFRKALQQHRISSQYFPTVTEIIQGVYHIKVDQSQKQKALPRETGPTTLSDEEIEKNLAQVQALLKTIGRLQS